MNQLPFLQSILWTVTELTRYMRTLLEADDILQDVWVQGEISNFSRASSGHLYFTLKDSGAALRCVMWRNNALRQTFLPQDGNAIEAHGYISVYEVAGQYQLYTDLIRPAGEGLLYQEFMRLKARLEAEGLFDVARKRPIPTMPGCIGLVTSPSAAALQDMLKTIRRRYPLVRVVLAPTPVQGEEAPAGIVSALQLLNQVVHPDVIILARGGGSIEDLWAFNDESVARAIVASSAPLITGIGHETDFTIADFTADLRAPTPTAAAELATPDQQDLRTQLSDFMARLNRTASISLERNKHAMDTLKNRLQRCSPVVLIRSGHQRLDELTHRARLAVTYHLNLKHSQLESLAQRLFSLSPQAILERGYAIVTHQDGELVRSIKQIQPGDDLNVQLSDGQFDAQVQNNVQRQSLPDTQPTE